MEAAIQSAEAKLEELVKESENPSLASDAKKLMDITQKISAAQAEVRSALCPLDRARRKLIILDPFIFWCGHE